MSTARSNGSGTAAIIQAVFYQHGFVYAEEFRSVEAAVTFLNGGEDRGILSSVGVFVDGEPRVVDQYVGRGGRAPSKAEAKDMLRAYAEAERIDPEPGDRGVERTIDVLLAERDRYRVALEKIADAERAEDADAWEWAVFAHDLAQDALKGTDHG